MLRTEVVALDAIEPNPDNPRKEFDEDGLAALAKTFAFTPERPGEPFTPPVVVKRPGRRKRPYMIVDGERRWRAMRAAGVVDKCACTVADNMDEANALVAMICTDSKVPLTDEEKSMGVQQALLLELDDETVEAAAMLPKGSAARVRRVVSKTGRPVQGTLDLLFAVAELEDDDLFELGTSLDDPDAGQKVRQLKEIQSRRRLRGRLVEAIEQAGIPVFETQADIPEGTDRRYLTTIWEPAQLPGECGDVVAAVVAPVDETVSEGWYYRDPVKAVLYRHATDDGHDDAVARHAEVRRLLDEADHEFGSIKQAHASFVFEALADGSLEYDPVLDEPTALQQVLEDAWRSALAGSSWKDDWPEPDPSSMPEHVLPLIWDRLDSAYGGWVQRVVVDEDYVPDDYDLKYCRELVSIHEALCDLGYEPGGYEAGVVAILRACLAGDGDE